MKDLRSVLEDHGFYGYPIPPGERLELSPDEERTNRALILAALLEHPGQMPLALASSMSLRGRKLHTFLRAWWILRDAGHIAFTGDTPESSRWHPTPAGRSWYAANASLLARALMKGAIP